MIYEDYLLERNINEMWNAMDKTLFNENNGSLNNLSSNAVYNKPNVKNQHTIIKARIENNLKPSTMICTGPYSNANPYNCLINKQTVVNNCDGAVIPFSPSSNVILNQKVIFHANHPDLCLPQYYQQNNTFNVLNAASVPQNHQGKQNIQPNLINIQPNYQKDVLTGHCNKTSNIIEKILDKFETVLEYMKELTEERMQIEENLFNVQRNRITINNRKFQKLKIMQNIYLYYQLLLEYLQQEFPLIINIIESLEMRCKSQTVKFYQISSEIISDFNEASTAYCTLRFCELLKSNGMIQLDDEIKFIKSIVADLIANIRFVHTHIWCLKTFISPLERQDLAEANFI